MTKTNQYLARSWLLEFLWNKPQPAAAIYDAGKRHGFSEDQLKRAKADINKSQSCQISVFRGGFKNGHWIWALQQTSDAEKGTA